MAVSNAPNPLSLPAGTSQALTVTSTYTDASTADLTASATFSSASSSIAAVNVSGQVYGVSAGATKVTATLQGVSATNVVTVTNALLNSVAITPAALRVALGSRRARP